MFTFFDSHLLVKPVVVLGFTIWFFLISPAHGQTEEKKREQIGEVLGKPVYRDQIKTGADVRLSDEMHRLFSRPVGEKYFREHKKEMEPTKEEIEETARYVDKKHQEKVKDEAPELRRKLKTVEEKLKGKGLSEKQKSDLEIEKIILETKLEPPGKSFAQFLLDNWKYHKHLYDHFGGGRIQWQQVGLQAFDASRVFLETFEKKGDFKITDPKLRDALYSYWKNESHLITDKEEIREQFLEADWLPMSLKKSQGTKPE